MTLLVIVLVLLAVSLTGPFLGRDSRDLDDEHPDTRADRLPR